jgi:hypothetical protein
VSPIRDRAAPDYTCWRPCFVPLFSCQRARGGPGGTNDDLLVFSPASGSLRDIDDQWLKNKVRVAGRVARMTAEVERQTEPDLDRRIEIRFEKPRPVIIARSVERTVTGAPAVAGEASRVELQPNGQVDGQCRLRYQPCGRRDGQRF